MKKISFVIPVYNEEETIPALIQEISRYINKNHNFNFEVILVENGSGDTSFNLLKKAANKDNRFKILQLSRNFGCDGGIVAGMHESTGDAVVIMMADLQEPIRIVSAFIKKWQEGYDIVYGIVKKRTSGRVRNKVSVIYYKLLNLATKNAFPENASDFRLIDKKVYQTLNTMPEQNKYLRGLVMWTGFKHVGVLFDRKKRFAGESKADFLTVFQVARNG